MTIGMCDESQSKTLKPEFDKNRASAGIKNMKVTITSLRYFFNIFFSYFSKIMSPGINTPKNPNIATLAALISCGKVTELLTHRSKNAATKKIIRASINLIYLIISLLKIWISLNIL